MMHENERAVLRAEIEAHKAMSEGKIDNMRDEMRASIGQMSVTNSIMEEKAEEALYDNSRSVMAEKDYLEILAFNPSEGAAGSANIAMAAAQMMMQTLHASAASAQMIPALAATLKKEKEEGGE